MKIFINPGHCIGRDSGAVNEKYGIEEAAVVANVGAGVKNYLEAAGHEVKVLQSDNLSGENPIYPNVCLKANTWPAELFISIHCNSFTNERANGTECCVYSHWSEADRVAYYIQNKIVEKLGTFNRGVKERNNLIVLKGTNMPAVLVELAFLSNEADCQKLMHRQDEFAKAIAEGVLDYLSDN